MFTKQNWKPQIIIFAGYIAFITMVMTCESTETSLQTQQSQQPQVAQNWIGDGGKGMSLAILAPQASGLADNQNYLPSLVQGEFVSNFSSYSAIAVLDRQSLDTQYAELLSGYYDDNAKAGQDLGHLTPTTYIMGGKITKTATGYALQMQITRTADKMTTASYSGTFAFADLDNFTGIRRASLDLLQKMGVTLTTKAQGELAGAATENRVNAQTALAKGITAQQQGTEVAALSYYYQASAYDPSMSEAVNRSSILNANISSGNIGNDVRNDIAWRKTWVARLTETEQFFDSFNKTASMPYTLFYVSNEIKQLGDVNYQNETITLTVDTHLHGSGIWTLSMERALQAVWDGLNATGRKDTWQLAGWPAGGVTNLNAFAGQRNTFSVVFELLNDQNKVIGRQTLQSNGSWSLNGGGRPVINVSADDRETLKFQNVNANDISDKMTIRIASVNGVDAATAARNGILQMRAITRAEFDFNYEFRFVKGEIQGATHRPNIPAGYGIGIKLPDVIWDEPVVSIGNNAFADYNLTDLILGNNVQSIGAGAFKNHHLTSIILPVSVNFIGEEAFYFFYRENENTKIDHIVIGVNVVLQKNAFGMGWMSDRGIVVDNIFQNDYSKNGKQAGIYTRGDVAVHWKFKPLVL